MNNNEDKECFKGGEKNPCLVHAFNWARGMNEVSFGLFVTRIEPCILMKRKKCAHSENWRDCIYGGKLINGKEQ